MEEVAKKKSKSSVRVKADKIKNFRCKNLIAVIESPEDIKNIGTVIRNVNALGVESVYVVDPRKALPDDWQEIRERRSLMKTSVSAVKWTFVKRFDSTQDCIERWSRKFVPGVKMDCMTKVTIQNEETKEPFTRV